MNGNAPGIGMGLGRALSKFGRRWMENIQYEDALAQQSLVNALRQAAFEREGKWHQQDVDWREAQATEDKRRWAAMMTQRDKDMDYRMFRDRLEAEMEGVRSREAADLQKALINLGYDRREALEKLAAGLGKYAGGNSGGLTQNQFLMRIGDALKNRLAGVRSAKEGLVLGSVSGMSKEQIADSSKVLDQKEQYLLGSEWPMAYADTLQSSLQGMFGGGPSGGDINYGALLSNMNFLDGLINAIDSMLAEPTQ